MDQKFGSLLLRNAIVFILKDFSATAAANAPAGSSDVSPSNFREILSADTPLILTRFVPLA